MRGSSRKLKSRDGRKQKEGGRIGPRNLKPQRHLIEKDAERQSVNRVSETEVQHQQRIENHAKRQAALRANQTPEQQVQERIAAKERISASRNYSSAGFMDATRIHDCKMYFLWSIEVPKRKIKNDNMLQ